MSPTNTSVVSFCGCQSLERCVWFSFSSPFATHSLTSTPLDTAGPLTEETRGLIGAEELALLPPRAVVVNTHNHLQTTFSAGLR